MTELRLKILIDGKEANAVIDVTDENIKELYKSFKYGQREVNGFTTAMSRGFNNAREILQGVRETWNVLNRAIYSSIGAYQSQELANVKLATALKQNGQYTRDSYHALIDYATQLQQMTVYGDDATITVMAQLQAMGLSTEQTKQATLQAANLATIMQTDLSTAARVMGDLFAGNATMIGRYVKGLDETVIKSGDLDAILALLNERIGGQAEAAASTGAGAISKMRNTMGDLQESTGMVMSQGIAPFVSLISSATNSLQQLDPHLIGIIGTAGTLTVVMVLLRTVGIGPAGGSWVPFVAGIRTARTQMRAAAMEGYALSGSLVAIGTATRGLMAALGPAGWIILGLTAVVSVISLTTSATDALSGATTQILVEKAKIQSLVDIVRDSNKTLAERKSALSEIQKIQPEYLRGIDLEKTSQAALEKEISGANMALEQQVRLKILNERYEAAVRKRIEAEQAMSKPAPTIWDGIVAAATGATVHMVTVNRAMDEHAEALKEEKQILGEINNTRAQSQSQSVKETRDVEEQLGVLGKIEKDIKDLEARRTYARSIEELAEIDMRLRALTAQKKTIEAEVVLKMRGFDRTAALPTITAGEAIKRHPFPSESPKEKMPEEVQEQRRIQLIENEFERQRELARFELKTQQQKYGDLEILRKEYDATMAEIDRAEADRASQLAAHKLAVTVSALSFIGSAVAQHTVLGKAVAAAQATINTYEAATMALTVGPMLGPILATMITALGMAQVARIVATATPSYPGYAEGGIVVGEKGPEIISPMQSYAQGQAQLVAATVRAVRLQLESNQTTFGGDNQVLILKKELAKMSKQLKKLKPQVNIFAETDMSKYDRTDKKLQRTRAAVTL